MRKEYNFSRRVRRNRYAARLAAHARSHSGDRVAEGEPRPTRAQTQELDRRLKDLHDRTRYLITSGELHTGVGGYPGHDHRMPLCCQVMKDTMREGDVILQTPPSGQGATLIVQYRLPIAIELRVGADERRGGLGVAAAHR